jgi:putative transposase
LKPAEPPAGVKNTDLFERLDGEIKRRTEVGIFLNEAGIKRLIGAILLQQNDEWAVQRARYMKQSRPQRRLDQPGPSRQS